MKRLSPFLKSFVALLIVFAVTQTVRASSLSGTVVSVNPNFVHLVPGKTAKIAIKIDLAEGDLLRGFSVKIAFDPDYLSAQNLEPGDFMNPFLLEPYNGIENGVISFGLAQGSVDPPASGSGTLFTFEVLARDVLGATGLEIISVELVGDDYLGLDCEVLGGAVEIGEGSIANQLFLPLILHQD